MSNIKYFADRFQAGIDQLKNEINGFASEADLWKTPGTISNCAGNLSLHLIGNLNHFIGAQLGATGFVRERDKEFNDKNVPRSEMITALTAAEKVVAETFAKLTDDDLQKTYPLETFGPNKSTLGVLIILIGHLNYHLGQINYLRRM